MTCFPLPCPRCTEQERDRAVEARREAGEIRRRAFARLEVERFERAELIAYFERQLQRIQLQLIAPSTALEMAGVNEDDYFPAVVVERAFVRYPWWRRLMWHITRSR